jgi:hypothetical protein
LEGASVRREARHERELHWEEERKKEKKNGYYVCVSVY